MKSKEFEKCVETRYRKCIETLLKKSEEYADEFDRLHNFKVAAELQNCTPEKALAGMMCKHTVSIFDLINDLEEGKSIPLPLWEEKIGDSINYLFLLTALVEEREC